ncbi:iron chelate uptake ABC transporter family permease subunit [Algoriphagus namhaensis]
MKNKTHVWLLLFGVILLLLAFLVNISLGSVQVSLSEIVSGLFSGKWSKASSEQIILNYRLPKAFVAILAGVGLSISGLQMQTFFRNPLAGPYVLGISSGAGLGVALLMLAGSGLGILSSQVMNPWAVVLAGSLGGAMVLLLVSLVAWRVRDSMTLLIVGLMVAAGVSAIISVLSYFAGADALKLFTIWGMGSLGGLGWTQLLALSVMTLLGLLPVIFSIKSYNAMLLGENYAESMGVNPKNLRWMMIISTGLLAGSITAFCGPIAFVGIAVPHLARIVLKSADHKTLFIGSAISGALLLLCCDAVSQLPGTAQSLPINAVTSLIGAPVVIGLVLRKNFSKEF